MKNILSNIQPTQYFPLALIILNLCAAGMCIYQKEYKRAVYWLAAAILNVTVTF